MAKQFLTIDNFGRGINNVKNPRDLATAEVADCRNWNISKNGELIPRSEFATATNGSALTLSTNTVPNITASLNAGYGLHYFEPDSATGVHGTSITGTNTTTNPAQGNVDGSTSNYSLIFTGENIQICAATSGSISFWTHPNQKLYDGTIFPFRIVVSGTSSNDGEYLVTSLASIGTGTYASVTWNSTGTAMVCDGVTFTNEAINASTTVTIKKPGFVGDAMLAIGDADTNRVYIYKDSTDAIHSFTDTTMNNASAAFTGGVTSISSQQWRLDGYNSNLKVGQVITSSTFGKLNPNTQVMNINSMSDGKFYSNKVPRIEVAENTTYTFSDSTIDLNRAPLDWSGVAANEKPKFVFYEVDGALRIADGNLNNQTKPKWYGYIDRKVLVTAGSGSTYVSPLETSFNAKPGYYIEEGGLGKPSSAPFTAHGSVNNSDEMPVDGRGWGLSVTASSEIGEWEGLTYEFASSFIYDGNQESTLKKYNAQYTHSAGFKMLVNVFAQRGNTGEYPRRVSGGRIYIREAGSNDKYTLFVDIDITDGARTNLIEDYYQWRRADGASGISEFRITENNTEADYQSDHWVMVSDRPNQDTYDSINTFSPDMKQYAFGGIFYSTYQCAVVAGQRVFVANVKFNDGKANQREDLENRAKHFGDRIMFSQIGKYDTFLPQNTIDISKGDSESYQALAYYGDRLLAFKQRKVQVINIAAPSPSRWFLEDTVEYAGVDNQYSVCNTENGVVWGNSNGAFLYNGSEVVNISEGKIANTGQTSYSSVNWSGFINPNVGYIAETKQVIFVDSATTGEDAFYYDMQYKSWYYGANAAPNANNSGVTNGSSFNPKMSNFVNTSSGKLIAAYDTQSTNLGDAGANKVVLTYHQTAEQGHKNYLVQTKDLDFGNPGRKKKVYAIYINYRHSGSTAINDSEVEYMRDNNGSWASFNATSSTIPQTHSSNNNYSTLKLRLSDSGGVSCQSMAFKFNFDNLNEDSKFALNDIVIEYRVLYKRAA
tara:strand:+ start:8378 stop:11368 length:2991 start_codon:yes stop_codon:yes gene_type:complete